MDLLREPEDMHCEQNGKTPQADLGCDGQVVEREVEPTGADDVISTQQTLSSPLIIVLASYNSLADETQMTRQCLKINDNANNVKK